MTNLERAGPKGEGWAKTPISPITCSCAELLCGRRTAVISYLDMEIVL